MKVIDLLNKIANYEEIPLKIKVKNRIYRTSNGQYWCDETGMYLINNCASIYELNEEVEIIEDIPKEDKKIEKLTTYYGIEPVSFEHPRTFEENAKFIDFNAEQFFNKINEIIDKVNGKDEETK